MWHWHKTTARLGAVLLVMVGITGCQGFNFTLKKPKAQVAQVAVTEASEQGARVETTVRITNPNRTVLPLEQAYYRVTVDGAEPFAFTTVPAAALPGEGTQTLTLPAAVASDGQSLAGRSYTVRGYASYRPPGEVEAVLYGSGWPLPKTHFRAQGTLE
jgi:LEA14-like dessication related protein